jgi:hypothetical protein
MTPVMYRLLPPKIEVNEPTQPDQARAPQAAPSDA